MRLKLISFLLMPVLALAVHSGRAQTAPLSLTGNVQTEAQQALNGAAVTVIHVPSGKRYSAASNNAGRFVVANLPAGGPYLMQVGDGGYSSQTVESIFLENGKTANFSVTLSRLGSAEKGRAGRTTATTSVPAERLAAESEVGGPVLFAANTAAPSGQAPTGNSRRYQPVPQIISSPATAPTAGRNTAAGVPTANAGGWQQHRPPPPRPAAPTARTAAAASPAASPRRPRILLCRATTRPKAATTSTTPAHP